MQGLGSSGPEYVVMDGLVIMNGYGWSPGEYTVIDSLLNLNWNDERINHDAWLQSFYQEAGAPIAIGAGIAVTALRAEAPVVKAEAQLARDAVKAESLAVKEAASLSIPGKITGQFDMVNNPGPLANIINKPAGNFAGGKYREIVLSETVTFYRAGGTGGKSLGQWFTVEPPTSVVQVRIDRAVKPEWIDPLTGNLIAKSPIDSVYAVRVPAGTKIYVGPVSSQGGVYVGGQSMEQIFISEPWKINGVEVISKNLLK